MSNQDSRTEAVRLLAAGMKPHEVSEKLDIPETLLSTWDLDGEVATERNRQFAEIDAAMQKEANAMFGATEDAK